MKNYTYRAQWSVESGDYVGTCLEFPKESAHAPTPHEAVALIQATIGEVVASYLAEDVDPPPSITDRHYGGTFVVRATSFRSQPMSIRPRREGTQPPPCARHRLTGNRSNTRPKVKRATAIAVSIG